MKKIINFLKKGDIKFYIYEKISLRFGLVSVFFNNLIYKKRFSIGKRYKIWGTLRLLIDGDGKIEIGDNFHAVSDKKRAYFSLFSTCCLTSIHGGKIKIGNHVGLNGTVVGSKTLVSIGDDSMIAPNSIIIDHDGHSTELNIDRWKNKGLSSPILIGKNCWIGMNSIILKGVSIGDNTIVGAGSVVTKNCESNSLYAGNPAKKIKNL